MVGVKSGRQLRPTACRPLNVMLVNITSINTYWRDIPQNCAWLYLYGRACTVVSDSVTPLVVACQAALSMAFSRQEYWSGLPFPTPGDLLQKESNPNLLCLRHWQTEILYHCATWEAPELCLVQHNYNTACYLQLQKCMFTFQKHRGEDGAWLTPSLVNEGEKR